MRASIYLFIIPLFSFSIHKYYVALTEITHNKEAKSVEMIMNVFVDDLEVALNGDFNIDAKLNTQQELKNIDDYIKKYLEKKFKISINQQLKTYTFIGKEYEADIVYFYLEIENIDKIKTIEIENKVLTQYFNDQQNLIKVSVDKTRKSLFLSKENYKGLLNF